MSSLNIRGGTTIKNRIITGGGGDPTQYPWDIVAYPSSDSSGSSGGGGQVTYKAKVVPGIIGGVLPKNYDQEFEIKDGMNYGVVKCETDGERVTSAEIEFTATYPSLPKSTENVAPSKIDVVFGMAKKEKDIGVGSFNFFKSFIALTVMPVQLNQEDNGNVKFFYNWRIG